MIEPIYQCFTHLKNLTTPAQNLTTPASRSVSLALIPLFQEPHGTPQNTNALLQAAIYARATCLLNTDAVECRIPVKLYIEEQLRNRLTPQLKANAVNPDTDVLWFTPPKRDYAYLGKKSHLYYAPELAHHEWIFAWDADTYFLPKNRSKIFRRLLTLPKRIHYIRIASLAPHYKKKIRRFVGETVDIDALLHRIVGKRTHAETATIPRPIGYFFAFPPAQLHETHPKLIDSIRKYSPILGCDEITIALTTHAADYTLRTFPHIQSTGTYEYLAGETSAAWAKHRFVDIVHGRAPYGQTRRFVQFLSHLTHQAEPL